MSASDINVPAIVSLLTLAATLQCFSLYFLARHLHNPRGKIGKKTRAKPVRRKPARPRALTNTVNGSAWGTPTKTEPKPPVVIDAESMSKWFADEEEQLGLGDEYPEGKPKRTVYTHDEYLKRIGHRAEEP